LKTSRIIKVKFGSWPGENRDNEIVSIPGLRGRAKEISLKTCQIIHARVVEIVEQVLKSKPMDTKTPAKINWVLYYWWWRTVETHKQLVEYITGMDTRIDIQTSI
jgi:cell division protein FtsA